MAKNFQDNKPHHNEEDIFTSDEERTLSSSLILPDQALPHNLFVLPVNQAVIFPSLMAPLNISEPRFIATIEEAITRQRVIGLLLVQEGVVDSKTGIKNLYRVGVAVKILKRLKMPDGSVNLLIHSLKRFKVERVFSQKPHLVVECKYLESYEEKTQEMEALTRTVVSHVKKLSEVNPFFTEEMRLAMINAPSPSTIADIVAFALALPKDEAQGFLETLSVKDRFHKLLIHLKREQDVADLQKKIQDDVNQKINKMQREFFLREQLKAIRRELGGEQDGKDNFSQEFAQKIEKLGMPEVAQKAALDELRKFETVSEQSPEYNVSKTYLEMMTSLPWTKTTEDNLNLKRAREILDEEHFGLERVKERIVEFLAVRKLLSAESPDSKGTQKKMHRKPPKGSILCLVGPPGVGKTSIGRSIAETMEREFYRFSLGGMRDEAEIKGHRRTYVGALPGKIIQAIRRAGTKNPVLMLDEIDKLSQGFQGDPASALLEVLDPEQNSKFVDHYLDVPFDLSEVLFIATANSRSTIPEPLLDRMEVIEIAGYTLEEKEKIAQKHVIPSVLKEHGLKPFQVKIEKTALRRIIADYAREPGLRSLQRLTARLARKAAAQFVEADSDRAARTSKKTSQKSSKKNHAVTVKEDELVKWLGPKRFYNELAERINSPGVVVGLAWTSMGGEILFIEVTDYPGTGKLKITGQVGDVMNESASIAWSYMKRKLAIEGGVNPDTFEKRDFHLHIPAGAIPKDGPSAGITMASALYSLLTGRMARQKVAMTGELSLTGKVLPVGGIKEKLLAAKRAGIQTVILPKLNEKDMVEVPQRERKGLRIHFVSHVEDVFDLVLIGGGRSSSGKNKMVSKGKKSIESSDSAEFH
jgi:ATP-dependent Lon protease